MALRRLVTSAACQSWKNALFPRISKPRYSVHVADISRHARAGALSGFVRPFMSDDSPSSEERLAAEAARRDRRDKPNIFQKILDGEVGADTVYEDEQCMAFRDVNPVAPTHIIIIPRKQIPCLSEASDTDAPLLGHLLNVARKVAALEGLKGGYRIVMNDGRHGSQSIYHLHIHVIGGRQMRWPPG